MKKDRCIEIMAFRRRRITVTRTGSPEDCGDRSSPLDGVAREISKVKQAGIRIKREPMEDMKNEQ